MHVPVFAALTGVSERETDETMQPPASHRSCCGRSVCFPVSLPLAIQTPRRHTTLVRRYVLGARPPLWYPPKLLHLSDLWGEGEGGPEKKKKKYNAHENETRWGWFGWHRFCILTLDPLFSPSTGQPQVYHRSDRASSYT